MESIDLLEKAIKIAIDAHHGQKDKSGNPYIFHPLEVMRNVSSINAKIVAILHDVVEDTSITLEDLQKEGFSEEVLQALKLLTHDKSTPYMDYINSLKNNPLAKEVKIADLRHNMDISRIPNPSDKDYKRLEKYKNAILILIE